MHELKRALGHLLIRVPQPVMRDHWCIFSTPKDIPPQATQSCREPPMRANVLAIHGEVRHDGSGMLAPEANLDEN